MAPRSKSFCVQPQQHDHQMKPLLHHYSHFLIIPTPPNNNGGRWGLLCTCTYLCLSFKRFKISSALLLFVHLWWRVVLVCEKHINTKPSPLHNTSLYATSIYLCAYLCTFVVLTTERWDICCIFLILPRVVYARHFEFALSFPHLHTFKYSLA